MSVDEATLTLLAATAVALLTRHLHAPRIFSTALQAAVPGQQAVDLATGI